MIVFLGVLEIVHHRFTVDSPVAYGSGLDAVRHQVQVFLHEHENHLEPQLQPTVVANRRSLI